VEVGAQRLEPYGRSVGASVLEEIRALAAPLAGARVLHVNATPYGGGVAELLRSEVPLLRDLGIHADWKLITGDDEFFRVTKSIHNALQGARRPLSPRAWANYERHAASIAAGIQHEYDLVVLHDPQPLPLPHVHGRGTARWIWRCHIDTSEPQREAWEHLQRYFDDFDAAVFTANEFVPPAFPSALVRVIPPAIDPESPKNIELGEELPGRVLDWLGIDIHRPLVVQVSRFDRWKDPLGVIEAFRLARREVPHAQLALVGSMAFDDPEAWEIYGDIQRAAQGDPGISVFTNLNGVSNIEVNAFQRVAQVVVQKSLREGFGLVVAESLWKGTPVVAGRTGGIPLQLSDGRGGYLVDSVEECAARLVEILDNPLAGRLLGELGRARIRENYLLPRLLRDELGLYRTLLGPALPPLSGSRAAPAPVRSSPASGQGAPPRT
jgi:trehalose synthase